MIDWMGFITVFVASLVSACSVVALFSLALRLGDGGAAWRRPASIALFTICGIVVVIGIVLIVPHLQFWES